MKSIDFCVIIDVDAVLSEEPCIRNLAKVINSLFAMCFSASILITILYWTFVVDYSTYLEPGNPDDVRKLIVDVNQHGVFMLMIIVDYAMSLCYMTFMSLIYVGLFVILYLSWSLIHYAAGLTDPFGNEYIYYLLNWRYPQTAIPISIAGLLGTIGLHCLFSWIKYMIIASYVSESHRKRGYSEVQMHSETTTPVTAVES